MTSVRRSDFDVTNSVQVSSPRAVLRAVEVLYRPTWPGLSMEPLARAFEHFERLFAGRVPGYHGVDTVYHDRQHTLDITLALARLLVGHDRLDAEFVVGAVARPFSNGNRRVKYASGLDLLRQTPDFVAEVRTKRLDGDFRGAYRYLELLFDGRNPYLEAIDRNVEYLRQVLRSESWQLLRRRPPIFAATADPLSTLRGLMLGPIKRVWSGS